MMSLLPLLFSAWWADLDRPHRIWDQNFGMGLYPEQLIFPSSFDSRMYSPLNNKAMLDLYRPLAELLRRDEGGTSTITADKDTFKVILDVQQFKPEEINVKLINRLVVVEAKHEEKKDEHGLISRQFIRKYLLPEQVDEEKLASSISSDGILIITAPLKQIEENLNERNIKVEFTGKPALHTDSKEQTADEKKPVSENENREEMTENPTKDMPEKK
ncbi:protein lethal(2)essential for life-like [Apis dorsata]|uniref:protein lethal(2)essential for life-like n=1 Tax=Apis dorsata TaxID=7462 RepID=UPI0003DF63C0|nr:protein lethal(2)essential for life-like [Apis dorsata]